MSYSSEVVGKHQCADNIGQLCDENPKDDHVTEQQLPEEPNDLLKLASIFFGGRLFFGERFKGDPFMTFVC
jgi:hypothetical protein